MQLMELFAANGGTMSTAMLRSAGLTDRKLRKLINEGVLLRVRTGYYSHAQVPWSAIGRARAIGGAVSCVTVLNEAGIWTPRGSGLHLRLPRHHGSGWSHDPRVGRFAKDAELHIDDQSITGVRDDLATAMHMASKCVDRAELVAILDSMSKNGLASRYALDTHANGGNAALRWAVSKLDSRSGSGVESLVRAHFIRMRLRFAIQVRIGVWPVDFLIGDWLVIEIDGINYHSSEDDFDRDRRKDRELHGLGYTVLRFTYWDVILRWEYCEQEILRFVRSGRHTRGAAAVG